ncbi:MAG: hypothetical protein KAR00_00660 [Candidatus Pacebacteria bacterium]|nr:hypothetical protein [Candidatus Paceibacterota bacterium]
MEKYSDPLKRVKPPFIIMQRDINNVSEDWKTHIEKVRVIDAQAIYPDDETGLPISGEDYVEKLLENGEGWHLEGIFLVNKITNGVQEQVVQMVLVRNGLLNKKVQEAFCKIAKIEGK